jgi:regulatory protein
VAGREPGGAAGARGEAPRDTRAQDAGAAQIVAPRKVLDARAARLAAGDLLARRAWTRAELTTRLRRRGAPADVAAAVVAELAARGYLDDETYARHWVATRSARGYGEARLRAELRARGVAGSTIETALAAVDPDEPLARAREAARRRLPTLRRARPERAAARLRDYLLRRGFSGALVSRVVREVTGVADA